MKHGVIGQETTGAGGFANALRTIPVSLEIAKDVKDICPDAWLLNFQTREPSYEALTRSDVKTFYSVQRAIGIRMQLRKPWRGTAQNQHRCFGFEPLVIRHSGDT